MNRWYEQENNNSTSTLIDCDWREELRALHSQEFVLDKKDDNDNDEK